MVFRKVVLVATVAAVGACSCQSAGRKSAAVTTTTSTSNPPNTAPPVSVPTPLLELTGYRIAAFTCQSSMSPGTSVRLPITAVTTTLLCPPEIPRQQQQPLTLTHADAALPSLLVALAAPDAPRSTGACPAIVTIPSPILVRTPALTVLVKVPVDGCGFPQQAVQAAIGRARAD